MKYSFEVKTYSVGADPVWVNLSQHVFVFCTKGFAHVCSEAFDCLVLCANEMMSLPHGSAFYILVFEDVTLLFHYFEELEHSYVSFNAITKSCERECDTFTNDQSFRNILPICYPVSVFVHSILMYLEYRQPDENLCKIKHSEVLCLLYSYYRSDQLYLYLQKICRMVSPFRCLVLKHYRHAKSTKDLACLCNFGLHSFRRIFKAEFGISPYKWVIQKRAEGIRLRLSVKHIPLIDIVDEFHFLSSSHFTVFCKRYLGDTPQRIRRRYSD